MIPTVFLYGRWYEARVTISSQPSLESEFSCNKWLTAIQSDAALRQLLLSRYRFRTLAGSFMTARPQSL
jgi:hypothetical protein